jgi:hypothetical protein
MRMHSYESSLGEILPPSVPPLHACGSTSLTVLSSTLRLRPKGACRRMERGEIGGEVVAVGFIRPKRKLIEGKT